MNDWRQYRKLENNEFILVGVDTSAGAGDYTTAVFISKTKIDVPLVYRSKKTATELTNQLVIVLEQIHDITNKKPIVAYERNNGGSFEMDRLAALNRLNKYDIFKMPNFGRLDPPESVKYGWSTNTSTRPTMLQDLKNIVDNKGIRIYDEDIINEGFFMAFSDTQMVFVSLLDLLKINDKNLDSIDELKKENCLEILSEINFPCEKLSLLFAKNSKTLLKVSISGPEIEISEEIDFKSLVGLNMPYTGYIIECEKDNVLNMLKDVETLV